jgi:hypothetical protein
MTNITSRGKSSGVDGRKCPVAKRRRPQSKGRMSRTGVQAGVIRSMAGNMSIRKNHSKDTMVRLIRRSQEALGNVTGITYTKLLVENREK